MWLREPEMMHTLQTGETDGELRRRGRGSSPGGGLGGDSIQAL